MSQSLLSCLKYVDRPTLIKVLFYGFTMLYMFKNIVGYYHDYNTSKNHGCTNDMNFLGTL